MESEQENTEVNLYATNILMESMYKQIWAFCHFMNDTNGNVPTWKYVDYALYSWKERLKKEFPLNGDNKGEPDRGAERLNEMDP